MQLLYVECKFRTALKLYPFFQYKFRLQIYSIGSLVLSMCDAMLYIIIWFSIDYFLEFSFFPAGWYLSHLFYATLSKVHRTSSGKWYFFSDILWLLRLMILWIWYYYHFKPLLMTQTGFGRFRNSSFSFTVIVCEALFCFWMVILYTLQ